MFSYSYLGILFATAKNAEIQGLKWQNRIAIITFNFLRKKNNVHKIGSRNSTLHKFHVKIYVELFESIELYVSFIWNHLLKYILKLEHHI